MVLPLILKAEQKLNRKMLNTAWKVSKYTKIRSISPYSIRMREIRTKNSVSGHFSRSENVLNFVTFHSIFVTFVLEKIKSVFFKVAAQAFEVGYFLNKVLEFLWQFSYKTFSYKKKLVILFSNSSLKISQEGIFGPKFKNLHFYTKLCNTTNSRALISNMTKVFSKLQPKTPK